MSLLFGVDHSLVNSISGHDHAQGFLEAVPSYQVQGVMASLWLAGKEGLTGERVLEQLVEGTRVRDSNLKRMVCDL